MASDHQEIFDLTYITVAELCEASGLSTTQVHYSLRLGLLPEPIRVGSSRLLLWLRDEVAEFILEAR